MAPISSAGRTRSLVIIRFMSLKGAYLGLHLGAEYNGDHGAAGPSMNELVRRYLHDGTLQDTNYFPLLVEQVACFGDPTLFYYDDVSRVHAGGSHSAPDVYRENVRQSVDAIASLIHELAPPVIIVAGIYAYKEFTRQILPTLVGWRGDLVRTRNPSVQGHRGSLEEWKTCYRSFRSDLLLDSGRQGVRKWHLHATNAAGPFRLQRT